MPPPSLITIAVEAPLVAQDLGQQLVVHVVRNAVPLVVGGHERVGVGHLDGHLEGIEVVRAELPVAEAEGAMLRPPSDWPWPAKCLRVTSTCCLSIVSCPCPGGRRPRPCPSGRRGRGPRRSTPRTGPSGVARQVEDGSEDLPDAAGALASWAAGREDPLDEGLVPGAARGRSGTGKLVAPRPCSRAGPRRTRRPGSRGASSPACISGPRSAAGCDRAGSPQNGPRPPRLGP
jgi:hypothetical protein